MPLAEQLHDDGEPVKDGIVRIDCATVDLGAGRGPLDLVSVPRPDGSSWLAVGANFSNELLLYGPR